jgi:hypothetical protein
MARLLLLIAIAIPLWVGWHRFRSLPLVQQKKSLWQVGFTALILLLLLLILTGRLPWLMALFAALIPLLRASGPVLLRLLPGLLPGLMRGRGPQTRHQAPDAEGQSTVCTEVLELLLDHQSGDISGSVLKGIYAGRPLHDLDSQELAALYQYCVDHDEESAQLLMSYLDQRLGKDWHEQFDEHCQQAGASSGSMNPEEAHAILGLTAGASREQILAAHRSLMQKLHPDRGGNDYLAAQLNRARDCLLS